MGYKPGISYKGSLPTPQPSEQPRWIIVSFDGKRDRIMGGKRGGQREGPPKAIGTIAIPLDSLRDQLTAIGWRPPEGEAPR